MHSHVEKTKQAIDQIRATRGHVSELLSDTPEFQTRAEHVFDTLANSLEFAIGEGQKTGKAQVAKPKREENTNRTIMGMPVPAEKSPLVEQVNAAQPSRSDVDKLREDVAKAYTAFPTLSNKEIRNTLSNLEVLGVAKAAGMDISAGKDIRITDAYINEIRVAMEEKAQHEADVAQADEDAQGIKEGETQEQVTGTPALPVPPATKKQRLN